MRHKKLYVCVLSCWFSFFFSPRNDKDLSWRTAALEAGDFFSCRLSQKILGIFLPQLISYFRYHRVSTG